MAQPDPYDRVYNFQNYQAVNPTTPLPANQLDAELNAVKISLDQTQENLARIQRDDGAIANQSVGYDQFKDEVVTGFNAPTLWVTLHNYVTRDTVTESGKFYRCLVSHTSGTFATDLAALKWELIADFTPVFSSSSIAAAIHAASSKATPVDADEFGGVDSAASFNLRRFTWANIKATLFASWGALIAAATGKTTLVDADTMSLSDSAAGDATKKVTIANLRTSLITGLASGSVISWNSGDVTLTHSADTLTFAAAANGYLFANGPVAPATSDGSALGTPSLPWSDLFLANGGVINWGNGDGSITFTDSGGIDTMSFVGANSYAFDALVSTTGNLTVGGTANFNGATVTVAGATSLNTLTIAAGAVVSGTYTPTLTNGTNVAASTAFVCHYIRVGAQVMVSGKINIDPTAGAGTSTDLLMSLPIASNLANEEELAGSFAAQTAQRSGRILGEVTGNTAQFVFVSEVTANTSFGFHFTYTII